MTRPTAVANTPSSAINLKSPADLASTAVAEPKESLRLRSSTGKSSGATLRMKRPEASVRLEVTNVR